MTSNFVAQIFTTLLAFAIFLFFAKKLFWAPLLATLDQRRALIKQEFDTIDQATSRVSTQQAGIEARLAAIEAEHRARVQEGITEGKRLAEQLQAQARAEIAEMRARSEAQISQEMEKARHELKAEVVRLTLASTEKLIRQRLDGDQQRELVHSFVEELSKK